jgi:hypothetical protein
VDYLLDKRVGDLTADIILDLKRNRAALLDDPNSKVTAQITIVRQRAHRVSFFFKKKKKLFLNLYILLVFFFFFEKVIYLD